MINVLSTGALDWGSQLNSFNTLGHELTLLQHNIYFSIEFAYWVGLFASSTWRIVFHIARRRRISSSCKRIIRHRLKVRYDWVVAIFFVFEVAFFIHFQDGLLYRRYSIVRVLCFKHPTCCIRMYALIIFMSGTLVKHLLETCIVVLLIGSPQDIIFFFIKFI